jgi:hypothetical protein
MHQMIFLLLPVLISAAHADIAKTRMRACPNENCKSFVQSAEIFKRKYCPVSNQRSNCYQSVEKVVFNVMKDSKFPQKADHVYWGKFVKEGEIHVPASKRSDF